MKNKTWKVGFALLALAATPAFAETEVGQFSLDGMVVPVGCDSCCGDSCCGDPCCGDPCCGDPCCGDPCCGDACGCGCGVGGGGLLSGIGNGALEGFSLSSLLGFESLDIGGWTQFGYHDQLTPLATATNDGASFNNVPKNLNLQQQWFYIGKEADGSNGLGLGFRADFIYGTDAQKTQSFGNKPTTFDNDPAWDHGEYGWAIPQLYGEIAVDDFSVKIGHFFTLVGYEVIGAPGNFFYSHALTMFNSEPFTHTGVLSTYSGFESLTLYGGWTLGWDTGFDNLNSGNSAIGGFAVNLGDSVTMTYINTYGNFGMRDGGQDDSYSHSIVFDVSLTDSVNYVFQSDMVGIDPIADNGAMVNNNDQFSINQYLFYTYNDIVKFGTRMEWWKSDGTSNYELTSGVNVKLLGNLIMRPEFRKDWNPSTGFDQDMFGCDMILTY
ncbi:MAG: porin [Planctomycetales bacterium]|nr:porin [Planctomycetales bacterium]